ncbi:MAG: hypothetical protein WC404_05770, partial [Candidatus Omnitrophota bacterium]
MRKKSFTLTELIIVAFFMSILVGSISWVFVVGLRTWSSGAARADIRQDANLALEKMVRDLSQASGITAADANNITFAADTDANGVNEIITFRSEE